MKKTFKKLLSILMVFCMVMGMMPVQAFATMIPTVTLDQEELTLEFGKTATLNATIDLYEKYEPSWGSSDESVAKVDSNGVVTAVGIGEAEITVTVSPRSDAMAAIDYPVETCVVTVVPAIISEVSATVTEPFAGQPISFEAIAGGEGYTATVEWEDDDCQIYPEDEAKFEEGKQYYLVVMFSAKPGYVFAEDAPVVINDKTPEDKEIEETSAYGLLTFAPKAVSSIESVKLSNVTEPVVGATPDFDITLTGTGAMLDDSDEYPAINWYKYDSEVGFVDVLNTETPFSAGTYCLEVNLKAEDEYKFTEDTKFYYGDDELPEFNGSVEHNYELNGKDYASIYLYFTLESATPVQPAVALNESAITLTVGGTATLVPTITPADLPNYALSWASDDESVATVDSNGTVTAVAEGTATITVTLNPNNVTRSTETTALPTASCVVTVVPQDVPQEPTTSVTVTKVWDDNNNANRPTSVRVAIYANGVQVLENVLSDRNNWTWTEEFPVAMGDGTPIVYTVDELEIPADYEKAVEKADATTGIRFVITNTLKPTGPEDPETVTVSGTKTWVGDEENYETVRPDRIIVNLIVNDEVIDETEATRETQWTYSFGDLPKYDEAGNEIEYTVQEEEVDGYTASYDGFDITNTLNDEDDKEDEDEEGGNGGATTPTTPSAPSTPYVPDTSDNTGTLMYLTSLICAAAALVVVVIYRRKRRAE